MAEGLMQEKEKKGRNRSMEQERMRAKSFRYEDYNTRRVFLRSYPLHWGSESEAEVSIKSPEVNKASAMGMKEEPAKVRKRTNGNKQMKKIILAVIEWGEEKVLVLRRFKNKITIYVVSCVNFKAPTALISAR